MEKENKNQVNILKKFIISLKKYTIPERFNTSPFNNIPCGVFLIEKLLWF